VHRCPLALLPLALAFLECNGEWSFVIPPWDAGAPSARNASVCGAWAKRRCDYEDRCPVSIYFRWISHAQCIERSTLSCELIADDPNVAFDTDLVGACSYPTDCKAPVPFDFCLSQGRTPVGAACLWSEGCQTFNCQRVLDATTQSWRTCGVCRPAPRGCDPACPAGEDCLFSGADAGSACVVVPTVGQPCDAPLYICRGSYCQGETPSGAGVCTAFAGLGEACSGTSCGPGELYCDDTLHCSSLSPAAYGQLCEPSKGGSGYRCTAYGTCDFQNTGRCLPPSPDGAPCDPNQGLRCLPPAECIAHHCLLPSLADCSL
jgi:hypothetical protein